MADGLGGCSSALKLPVTFDSWYTTPGFCHYLDHELKLPYVGTLAEDTLVRLQTGEVKVSAFAQHLKDEHEAAHTAGKPAVFRPIRIAYKGEQEHYYSYCATHRVNNFGKVRLVINHRQADLSDKPVCYITNQRHWQAPGITPGFAVIAGPWKFITKRARPTGWTSIRCGTSRLFERHVALVAVVYCLLRTAQHDHALHHKLQRELKFDLEGSAPFWRRVTQAQSLWSLALFISTGLAQKHSLSTIMAPLLRTVCAL